MPGPCLAASHLCGEDYTVAGMSATLVVNEIFLSLQGESTVAGLPCVFVRLTGCDLRCSYCDTAYAFTEGRRMALADVLAEVQRLAAGFGAGGARGEVRGPKSEVAPALRLPLVELTGGEPLLQKNYLPLLAALADDGFTVLLETSGAHDISAVDPRVRRIVDLKCPSSGEAARNRWANLPQLRATDEIKFVIATVEDYEWASEQIARHQLAATCPVLLSWAHPVAAGPGSGALKPLSAEAKLISRRELAERILADALPVRFQAQLHKVIWPPDQRGV